MSPAPHDAATYGAPCSPVSGPATAPGSAPAAPARIALYSHDSTGLGHVRRNLLLAQHLSEAGHDVLIVSGSPEAAAMPRPPCTDIVTLPALGKDEHGAYRARHFRMGIHELTTIRRAILTSTLGGFAPDLLVVDRHARGFRGELEPALERLTDTRVVLGMRDVIDAAPVVRREWHDQRIAAALQRWYDEIWLYGDARLHHPLDDAGLLAPVPVTPVGYLNASRPSPAVQDSVPNDRPFVLCMLGGGADGARAATAVADAPLPEGLGLVVVTGPQMPAEDRSRLQALDRRRPELTVLTFAHDPAALLARAHAAVVMGGYNTVCEVLASQTPALVLPRAEPRLEQHLRARALADAGLLDMLPLARADGRSIGRWLRDAGAGGRHARHGADLDGLNRIGQRVHDLLADARSPSIPTPAPGPVRSSATHQGVHHVAV
jgi:predicted glycosyltransferase